MIADQNFNDTCFAIIYPTASATVYGQRPKFFMAEHSATAEGENRAYGPTLIKLLEIMERNPFRSCFRGLEQINISFCNISYLY